MTMVSSLMLYNNYSQLVTILFSK